MSIAQSMAAELEHENATTRKVLERLPEDKFTWKPHQKSWSLAELASHTANIAGWAVITLKETTFELSPDYKPFIASSRQELLSFFDDNAAAQKEALTSTSNADMMATWKMVSGGKTLFEMPRVAVLRSMILNHAVHHRGQLSVYLRLLDVPVPAMYGPSADEAS